MNRVEGPRRNTRSYLPRIAVVAMLGGLTLSCADRGESTAPTTTGIPATSTSFVPSSELPPLGTTFPPAQTTSPTVPPGEQQEYRIAGEAVAEGIAGRFNDAETRVNTIGNGFIHGVAEDALDFTEATVAATKAYVSGNFEDAERLAELVENPAIQRTLRRVIDAARQREALGKINPTDPAWRQATAVGADGLRALADAATDTFEVLRDRANGIPATTTSTTSG